MNGEIVTYLARDSGGQSGGKAGRNEGDFSTSRRQQIGLWHTSIFNETSAGRSRDIYVRPTGLCLSAGVVAVFQWRAMNYAREQTEPIFHQWVCPTKTSRTLNRAGVVNLSRFTFE